MTSFPFGISPGSSRRPFFPPATNPYALAEWRLPEFRGGICDASDRRAGVGPYISASAGAKALFSHACSIMPAAQSAIALVPGYATHPACGPGGWWCLGALLQGFFGRPSNSAAVPSVYLWGSEMATPGNKALGFQLQSASHQVGGSWFRTRCSLLDRALDGARNVLQVGGCASGFLHRLRHSCRFLYRIARRRR